MEFKEEDSVDIYSVVNDNSNNQQSLIKTNPNSGDDPQDNPTADKSKSEQFPKDKEIVANNALERSRNSTDLEDNKIKQLRRTANPENWKQSVRKRLRQSGKEYVSANGKLMASRSVRPGCGYTCHLKCNEKFSEEQRHVIHNAFWCLSDEQKNMFYWKYTARAEPKRRRAPNQISKRANTFHYRFEVKGEMIPVCSKFFFATLDVTARRIYYFYEHCYQEDTCMPRELRRGKNPKPTLPDLGERLNQVRKHIENFPSVKLSGSSQKRYLSEDLNLTKMYRMYAKSVKDPLKQHYYCKVFNEEFNLGFRSPRSRQRVPIKKSSKGQSTQRKISSSNLESPLKNEIEHSDLIKDYSSGQSGQSGGQNQIIVEKQEIWTTNCVKDEQSTFTNYSWS